MLITANYLDVKLHNNNYLFFLLTEDYITSQVKINDAISAVLEELAKDVGKSALVVKPSRGDGKVTKSQILDERNWSEGELEQIRKIPGLLIIQTDLDKFNPRSDHWYYFSFQDIMDEKGEILILALANLFSKLADASKSKNIFDVTDEIARNKSMRELYNSFEFKPGAFGLSFDIKNGLVFLNGLLNRR